MEQRLASVFQTTLKEIPTQAARENARSMTTAAAIWHVLETIVAKIHAQACVEFKRAAPFTTTFRRASAFPVIKAIRSRFARKFQ
jgi:hypothetical protein